MEVEVKERLLSEADWQRVYDELNKRVSGAAAVVAVVVTPVHQKNVFFDTADGALGKKRIGMRLRFYEDKCLVTCKEPVLFANGINRAKETEEFISVEAGRAALSAPWDLPQASAVVRETLDRNVEGGSAAARLAVCGSFENDRTSFPFEGKVLELDRTVYDFGVRFEVEIECDEPETMRTKLLAFLDSIGVGHTASKYSKLACMFKKVLE